MPKPCSMTKHQQCYCGDCPKCEPRRGDVLRRHNTERRVTMVDAGYVAYVTPRAASSCRLDKWRTWAWDAEVTRRGE